jgi:hypothetical protein
VPSAAIKAEWLNGWVNTSSVTSTGAPAAFRRLIVSQTAVVRMTDARM